MNTMSIGDPLDKSTILARFHHGEPKCPSGGTYTYLSYQPEIGVLYCTCSCAKTKGHEPEDYSHW